jgi:hypothetical protein
VSDLQAEIIEARMTPVWQVFDRFPRAVRDLARHLGKQIRFEMDKATSSYDKEKLQERLAKLSGGVAVIRVGAPSEAEMKAKREALDVRSTRRNGGGQGVVQAVMALLRSRAGRRPRRAAMSAPACSTGARWSAGKSGQLRSDGGVVVPKISAATGSMLRCRCRRPHHRSMVVRRAQAVLASAAADGGDDDRDRGNRAGRTPTWRCSRRITVFDISLPPAVARALDR